MSYLFFDYDGTLTSHKDFSLHETTIHSLQEAKNNGHTIVLSTGRSPQFIKNSILPVIPFDAFISCAGCYVYVNDTKIFDNSIDSKTLEKVITLFNENDIAFALETDDTNYATKETIEMFAEMDKVRFDKHPERAKNVKRTNFEIIDKYDDLSHIHPGKIGFSCKKEKFLAIIDQFDEFFINYMLHEDQGTLHGEMNLKSCTKGEAMHKILDYYHGSIEDTIAFGDSDNDYPMIETAHYGFVHEDANERLKEIASGTFEDSSKHGITQKLKELHII